MSAGITIALSLGAIAALSVRTPHSTKELGVALRALRGGDEPVYMLGNYYFDVPIYARLGAPARVVLDWSNPDIHRRDTWRKEIADAGVFAPPRAQAVLLEPAQLDASVCAQPVNWLIGPTGAEAAYPVLAGAQVVAHANGTTLWRVDRHRVALKDGLNCPETPKPG